MTLDKLLGPGYEPGDGLMEGAQLVESEWYDPVFGCDSLQSVIDNLKRLGIYSVIVDPLPSKSKELSDPAQKLINAAVGDYGRATDLLKYRVCKVLDSVVEQGFSLDDLKQISQKINLSIS
jgi:hypothetical protein